MERKSSGASPFTLKPSTFKNKTDKKEAKEPKETPDGGPAASEPYQRDGRLYEMRDGKEIDITPKG